MPMTERELMAKALDALADLEPRISAGDKSCLNQKAAAIKDIAAELREDGDGCEGKRYEPTDLMICEKCLNPLGPVPHECEAIEVGRIYEHCIGDHPLTVVTKVKDGTVRVEKPAGGCGRRIDEQEFRREFKRTKYHRDHEEASS